MHYVIDLWAAHWRRHEATGGMIIVRYADDLVAGFEHEADARRFLEEMRARLAANALSLRPDKTRIIEFGRHAAANRKRRGLGKPETFNFLGVTFICGKSRRGGFLIKRKSRRDRMQTSSWRSRTSCADACTSAPPLWGGPLREGVKGGGRASEA